MYSDTCQSCNICQKDCYWWLELCLVKALILSVHHIRGAYCTNSFVCVSEGVYAIIFSLMRVSIGRYVSLISVWHPMFLHPNVSFLRSLLLLLQFSIELSLILFFINFFFLLLTFLLYLLYSLSIFSLCLFILGNHFQALCRRVNNCRWIR